MKRNLDYCMFGLSRIEEYFANNDFGDRDTTREKSRAILDIQACKPAYIVRRDDEECFSGICITATGWSCEYADKKLFEEKRSISSGDADFLSSFGDRAILESVKALKNKKTKRKKKKTA